MFPVRLSSTRLVIEPQSPKSTKRFRAAGTCLALLSGLWVLGFAHPTLAAGQQNTGEEEVIEIPPGFEDWRTAFRAEAVAQGIPGSVYDQALKDVTPDPRVLKRNAHQPEFSRPVWDYLDSAVSPARVRNGQAKLAQHRDLLAQVERRYGVPARVIVAIWGLESSYGAITGSYDVIRSLSTLAYTGRRQAMGRRELLAALKILAAGDKTRDGLKGSWAGAMGHTQFMPSSFLSRAVDFDGDGRRDIWDSLPDAFASTANFLAEAKWEEGLRWGREVTLPETFDYALTGMGVKRPIDAWSQMGVRRPGGQTLPQAAGLEASILVPGGHQGPAFFVYPNFRALMRYNASTAYALGISHLSDRIVGAGPISGTWPRHLKALSRTERYELQERLIAAGYSIGEVDGIMGARTRGAVRAFQKSQGTTPDGFVSSAVLEGLRETTKGKLESDRENR